MVHSYQHGQLLPRQTAIVAEFPLALRVNGRDLATLVASRHDLRYLVAGFLRLQGFVDRVEDFDMLAVCDEFGVANVRIRSELPEQLRPVLTSGCGTGLSFSLTQPEGLQVAAAGIAPQALFRLMAELARQADQYRSHGGIHSAAVGGPDGRLLLYAEDLGRHNTLDRIAGEALFKQLDLGGLLLVTSGRISAEMALKAARLGVTCIASRTSPTDMAVTICQQAGLALIGYLRGEQFTVYSGAERIKLQQQRPQLQRVDGFTNTYYQQQAVC